MADARQPGPGDSLARRLEAKYGGLLAAEMSIVLEPSGVGERSGDAVEGAAPAADRRGAAPRSPTDLARYAVGAELARGGMGAILEVWDRDLARPLAMKVLLEEEGHSAPAALQRFVREARITGQLDHPGIVPVHDLGIDDAGRIYFTMRLVRGEDLSKVFARARVGADGWSRARALEVFLKICDTVAYAHARGVVHRDLKPMNVMVGGFGEVYVLDWGLAKVLGGADDLADGLAPIRSDDDADATLAGAVLGTPSYMAPEQAAGHAFRAGRGVDVYSLGAMLYTLLAGRAPYVPAGRPTSSREVLEAVRRGPPAPLAELAPGIPAELARLCERAMAREPDDRHASASEIADELRAHLEGERLAAEENRRLRDQLADSRGVAEFLKGLFRVETPADAAKPVSIAEILDRGAAHIDRQLADQPAMRASVHSTLGDVQNAIGAHGKAAPHFEEAVRAAREHAAATGPDITLAHRLTGLGQVLYETGDYPKAEATLREAIALLRELGENGEPLARALSALCTLSWNSGRLAEAEPLAAESLALRRALPDQEKLAISLVEHGIILDSLGHFEAGEAAYLEALELRRRVLGPRHATVATVLNNLGALACYRGDFAGGAARYREALEIRREKLGAKHPKVALSLVNLGYALGRMGELEPAEAVLRECLALRLEILGPDHPNVAHALDTLAAVLVHRGAFAEAEEMLARARRIAAERGGDQHPLHAWIAGTTAELREAQGRHDEAIAELERAIALDGADGKPLTAHSIDHVFDLGRLLLRIGRREEAIAPLERCLEVYRRSFRPADPILVECEAALRRARG
jgi:serine/threonine-protein kinase